MNWFSDKTHKILVTGGAGILASEVVKQLLRGGFAVTVIDSLSTGSLENLPKVDDAKSLKFIRADLCEPTDYVNEIRDCDSVIHLATLRKWPKKTDYMATRGLISALRKNKLRFILLRSTDLVYGNARLIPTPETYGPLDPKMAYELSKLKSEKLVTEFASRKGIHVAILRFANIVSGIGYYGVVRDYFERLLIDPKNLRVLGDGLQRRSYVSVADCVGAMKTITQNADHSMEVYNVASMDSIDMHCVVDAVVEGLGLSSPPQIIHTGSSDTGGAWPGDPRILFPDTSKIRALEWTPSLTSSQAIVEAVRTMREKLPQTPGTMHAESVSLRLLEKQHWDSEYQRLNGP